MKHNKIIANFFWDKKKITLFEYCYLKSFLKNNFKVNVYSFEKIKLPKNVNLKDASRILKKIEMKKFIHQGVKSCPAAFADKFRIELMKKTKGWWFDMDILCLKKASEFKKLELSLFTKMNTPILVDTRGIIEPHDAKQHKIGSIPKYQIELRNFKPIIDLFNFRINEQLKQEITKLS